MLVAQQAGACNSVAASWRAPHPRARTKHPAPQTAPLPLGAGELTNHRQKMMFRLRRSVLRFEARIASLTAAPHPHDERHEEQPTVHHDEQPTAHYKEQHDARHDAQPTVQHDEQPTVRHDAQPTVHHKEQHDARHDEQHDEQHDERHDECHDERRDECHDEPQLVLPLAARIEHGVQVTRQRLAASRRRIVDAPLVSFWNLMHAAVAGAVFDTASVDAVLSAFAVLVAVVYAVAHPAPFDTARMVRSLESFAVRDAAICSAMEHPPTAVSSDPAVQLAAMQARSHVQVCRKRSACGLRRGEI